MLERYIDPDTDRMTRGKWQGEDVDDVADEDSDYLKGLLAEDALLFDDRQRIEKALAPL
jgi:hypothetical protein